MAHALRKTLELITVLGKTEGEQEHSRLCLRNYVALQTCLR